MWIVYQLDDKKAITCDYFEDLGLIYHREDGPALTITGPNTNIKYFYYYQYEFKNKNEYLNKELKKRIDIDTFL